MCSTMLVHCGTFAIAPALAQQGGQVAGQGNRVSISIPAQSLNSAIDAFSRATGWQVGYSSAVDGNARTNAVSGVMSPRQALRAMLARTGINVRITGPRSAALVSPSGSDENPPDTGNPPVNGNLLDTIEVTAAGATGSGFRGTPDWVYETPSSVSVITREAISESAVRDTNALFNAPAGVYGGTTLGAFPNVTPNIRGLQDSGRVIVSIDGARLNAGDGGRYGAVEVGGLSMSFVDTSFVRDIDITKMTDATANNAGSLGGTVDFRLIGADDIIQPGQKMGFEFVGATGTNGYDLDGSVIGAFRLGEIFSLTLGSSGKNFDIYNPGNNGDDYADFDRALTGREEWSTFAKLEAEYNAVDSSLTWLRQNTEFGYNLILGSIGNEFDVTTDTVIADLDWAPDSQLLNFSSKFWLQSTRIDETRAARPNNTPPETFVDKDFTSFGFILENTSVFSVAPGTLTFNYGVEAFRDDAEKTATSATIALTPGYERAYGSWSPPGRRDVFGGFITGTFEPADWITLIGGLRYDWSRLKGNPTYQYNQRKFESKIADPIISEFDYTVQGLTAEFIRGGADPFTAQFFALQFATDLLNQGRITTDLGEILNGNWVRAGERLFSDSFVVQTDQIDRSDGAWLPSATIELKPFDWLRPYASFSESFRPLTITEAFAAGNVSPGDTEGNNLAPNPNLRPERARTYEIGANIFSNGIFSENDALRLKISRFYREVEDYIVVGRVLPGENAVVDPDDIYGFVNLDGIAKMRGLEIEGNYDAGWFWFGGSYTKLKIDWPQRTDVFDNGIVATDGTEIIFNSTVPPEEKTVLDAGIRLFDRNLSIGGRANFVTPTVTARLDVDGQPVQEVGNSYNTYDLYGALRLFNQSVLRVTVNNVEDLRYKPANSDFLAPGRTVIATLEAKF